MQKIEKEYTMKISQIINRLAAPILLITGLIFAPAAANASCRIFQHRDYGGSGYTLLNKDRMLMVNAPEVLTTTNGHGERLIYQPSWNDQVSSFKVTDGCVLTLWQHINQGGARFRSSRSYLYVGDRWNDEVSEALCTCPG